MNGERTALAGCAFNGYLAAVSLGDVFDNRKAQSGTAQFAAAGFVDAIKSFKKTGQVLFGNADALVCDNNHYFRVI